MSTGGSQAGWCEPEPTGLKNSRCIRSTLASIANASDHIQSRGKSLFTLHLPIAVRCLEAWIASPQSEGQLFALQSLWNLALIEVNVPCPSGLFDGDGTAPLD